MAATRFRLSTLALAAAAALTTGAALAQTPSTPSSAGTVTVTGRVLPPLGVGGFGDVPLALTPLQAVSLGSQTLADIDDPRIESPGRWAINPWYQQGNQQ